MEGEHIPLTLGCGHSFGRSCLKDYMFARTGSAKCPHCRSDIRTEFDELYPNYTLISCLEYLKLDVRTVKNVRTASNTACGPGTDGGKANDVKVENKSVTLQLNPPDFISAAV